MIGLSKEYKTLGYELLASNESWDLIAAVGPDGRISHHEYFLVFQEGDSVENFENSFSQLNRTKVLGEGYTFEMDEQHLQGVRLVVNQGWRMQEQQAQLFLDRFVQILTK
ncbi:MAG: hypothetical protein R3194_01745 [Limnobacter sp.]|nr:hypothetical protein [Limnobacter sp.]